MSGSHASGAAGQAASPRWRRYLGQCALVALYVLALGLVLRLCARTYPGIRVPSSSFWNAVLNGDLFGYGYVGALLAGLLHIGQLTAATITGRPAVRWVTPIRRTLVVGCICLAAFGLYIAFALHRLPGMADGGS